MEPDMLPTEQTTGLTEAEFLARCRVAYRYGLGRPEIARLMASWLDAVMRYEHSLLSNGQTQGRDWLDFLKAEDERTGKGKRTLASDPDGYALQQIAAVFSHPCQECAASLEAWHTRPGFCTHRSSNPAPKNRPLPNTLG
jgi:hypothetical protein